MRYKIGDCVTNGYWFGHIIGVCGPWVWVIPSEVIDPENSLLDDGPLTFLHSNLDPFVVEVSQ